MTTVRSTTCPLDCPDACHLEAEVDGDRLLALGGGYDHPDTNGFICSKVARFGRRLDHPDRVLTPLRRVGAKGEGSFEPVSWDEALAEVAGRLTAVRERWGGEAILPYHYGGSNGWLSDGLLDALLFERLGASRLEKTVCAAVTGAVAQGMTGKMPGVAFADYARAETIVIWGANPRTSNIHLVPYLRAAKRRGAFLALVDPRRTLSERDCDLHLPVLPGTDLPVALATIAEIERLGGVDEAFLEAHCRHAETLLAAAREWPLERAASVAGVEAAALARLTRAWVEGSPAVVRCGWGPERNVNGGGAIAAILALPAVAGKFGLRGGGFTLSNSGAWSVDRGAVIGRTNGAGRRSLNMTRLGALLEEPLDPPVKALFVYNANPVVTVPEQTRILRGLARDDLFTVVAEQVMTDTARWADIVLPATTFLESRDLRAGYGSYVLGGVAPVVPRRGEARSNAWIFGRLGRELGFEDEAFGWDDDELARRVAEAARDDAGRPVDVETLLGGGRVPSRRPSPVLFGDGDDGVRPCTSDGRIDLAPPSLGPDLYRFRDPSAGSPQTPSLALVTPASRHLVTSLFGEHAVDRLEVALHPDDAERRGIPDRAPVRVFNDQGELRCHARRDARVRPGVAAMPKGAWRRSSIDGATSTVLIAATVNEVAGGARYNDARVEIELLEVPESP